MIDEGVVSEIGQTQKGTPKAKIGDFWYYGGRGVNWTPGEIGKRLMIEWAPFGDKGLRGAKNWSLHPHQPGAAELKASKPEGLDVPVNGTLTQPEMAFISNTVAHAIEAKLIQNPNDISTWVSAAAHAIRHYGDVIPFSEP